MKRTSQILSGAFIAIMLFLNLVLTIGLGNYLHAHILSDNQILIHTHLSKGGEHAQGHSCASNLSFSAFISYINNAQTFNTAALIQNIESNNSCITFYEVAIDNFHIPSRRGPPNIL